jgi:putative Holliday junction resolvase
MMERGRVLGIDLGSKRIGVAVTNVEQTVATGVKTVTRSGDTALDHRTLAAVADEWGAVGLVIGVPISLSGQVGPAAQAVLDEVAELRLRTGLEVDTVDERLTTVAAASSLRATGRRARRQREVIDQAAAALLLQTWVDRRKARPAGLR